MPGLEVARSEWPEYFAALSAQGIGARASVRVMGRATEAGGGRSAGWVLHGCAYDPAEDLLALELSAAGRQEAGLRLFFTGPREVLARPATGTGDPDPHCDAVQTLLSLTRCASPPDSVVAFWPSRT